MKFQTNLLHTLLQVSLKTTQRKGTDEKMEKTFQCSDVIWSRRVSFLERARKPEYLYTCKVIVTYKTTRHFTFSYFR